MEKIICYVILGLVTSSVTYAASLSGYHNLEKNLDLSQLIENAQNPYENYYDMMEDESPNEDDQDQEDLKEKLLPFLIKLDTNAYDKLALKALLQQQKSNQVKGNRKQEEGKEKKKMNKTKQEQDEIKIQERKWGRDYGWIDFGK